MPTTTWCAEERPCVIPPVETQPTIMERLKQIERTLENFDSMCRELREMIEELYRRIGT